MAVATFDSISRLSSTNESFMPWNGIKRICFVPGMVFDVIKTTSDYFVCCEFQLHTEECKVLNAMYALCAHVRGGHNKLNVLYLYSSNWVK